LRIFNGKGGGPGPWFIEYQQKGVEKNGHSSKSIVFLTMPLFSRKATPRQLELLVWGLVFMFSFLSFMPVDGPGLAAAYTIFNTFFYAVIIYGNINFLFPRLYERGQVVLYVVLIVVLLSAIGFTRSHLAYWVYNRFFTKTPVPFESNEIYYYTGSGVVIYMLSFVYRIALAYFGLKRQAEQMLEQKSLAELNLLKSQVQPHFLFNTLNNIYYEAFREAPRTALLIGRLSDIMRYFVDESPKEYVSLQTEVKFLENYIALEEIRIRHGVKVSFYQQFEGNPTIPPMLLITFVENIFKHGIDRSAPGNAFCLSLVQKDGFLEFNTENPLPTDGPKASPQGFGLKNLEKRLILLYGDRFELRTTRTTSVYQASLKIPLI
jgi:sensor histidine kinase YesM